mgnify:CR=1 FL=1
MTNLEQELKKFFAKASKETPANEDTGKLYSINCPICEGQFVSQCRCMVGNKKCANGHDWYKGKNGNAFLGTGHGQT